MVASNTDSASNDPIAQPDSSTAENQNEQAEDRSVIKSSEAHVARSASDQKDHNTLVLMWDDFPFSV
jgi:hypothetical protein